MKRDQLPEAAYTWLTDDVAEKLRAIGDPHRAKKRVTVVKLAFAKANQQRLDDVFDEPDTCARIIWYTKWKDDPVIAEAFEACYRRVLDWNDEQTGAIQAHFLRLQRQRVAEYAADAPAQLRAVMQDANQTGTARISAAEKLMDRADPETAGKVSPAQQPSAGNDILAVLLNQSTEELDQTIKNLQLACQAEEPEDDPASSI